MIWDILFFGLYSLILILISTPLNLLCFYIFKRLVPNRSNATIVVFSYLAVIEILIPFTWNLNYVVRELILKPQQNTSIKNLEGYSLFVCKLVSYGAYFSLQCAAWLKTLATFARCISLHHDWSLRKYLLKSTVIHRLSWITIILISLINMPIWFINGKRVISLDKYNHTQVQIKCYSSKFFQFWEIIHLLLYNFFPFTIMILCNTLIIRHVQESRHRMRQSKHSLNPLLKQPSKRCTSSRRSLSQTDGRLTRTLIFISLFFIIFTSPSAIFYISLGKIIKRHRNLITMGLSNLATTSHASSFIIYWFTSRDFRKAIYSFFCCRPLFSERQVMEEKTQDNRTCFHPEVPRTTVNYDVSNKLLLQHPLRTSQ